LGYFVLFYFVLFYFVLFLFGPFSSINYLPRNKINLLSGLVIALSGFPPSPLFFAKVYIVCCLAGSFLDSTPIILLLLANALILGGYAQCIIKYYVNQVTCQAHNYLF
jgi:hypothetical protein